MKIRKATTKDIPQILEVHRQSWMETYVPDVVTKKEVDSVFNNRNERIAQWEESLLDPDKLIRVIVKEAQILGFCVAERSSKQNRLSAIYILEKFQRKGLGKALWNVILSENFWNNNPIIVEVGDQNQDAHGFYKNLGFTFFKKLKPYVFGGGSSMECIEMIKN